MVMVRCEKSPKPPLNLSQATSFRHFKFKTSAMKTKSVQISQVSLTKYKRGIILCFVPFLIDHFVLCCCTCMLFPLCISV